MPIALHLQIENGDNTPQVLFLDPFFFETTKGNRSMVAF
jgi:hypothetical protein